MNRKNVFERFDYARSWEFKSKHSVPVPTEDVEVKLSPTDTLLSVVYAPDARTGLPTGDIQYFVSDKAPEDVKQFILKNLMIDVSAAKNVGNPVGLSDDALLELSRGSKESMDQYVQRLGKQIDDFKFVRELAAQEAAKQSANVPSQSE